MITKQDLIKLGFKQIKEGDLSGVWLHRPTWTHVDFNNEGGGLALDADTTHWTNLALELIGSLESYADEVSAGDDW